MMGRLEKNTQARILYMAVKGKCLEKIEVVELLRIKLAL
jgi:hypothetical protein